MKILSVKKRNPFVRAVTINHFKVKVQHDSGRIQKVNCWAGIPEYGKDYEVSSVYFSLEEKTGVRVFENYLHGIEVEGAEKLYAVVENKFVAQVSNDHIILQVNNKANSAQITKNTQASVGIRHGK